VPAVPFDLLGELREGATYEVGDAVGVVAGAPTFDHI
jgi:hypothetical protein